MKLFLYSIFAIGFSVQANAQAVATAGFVEVAADQRVAYESSITDPNKGTLILLPGIYRGMTSKDPFVQGLLQQNVNFVALHFSTQPASVSAYDSKQKTYFDGGQNVSSKKFAEEVESVIEKLNIKKPLIVSLSYSGSITQHLSPKKFPVVIETAPLGRFDESDPEAAAAFNAFANWLKFFPIWGDIYIKAAKENFFRQYWSKVAYGYASGDTRLNTSENTTRMTDGFVGMAKAVEEYDMRTQDFAKSPRRVFIFGENEEAGRKKIQYEALEKYQEATGVKTEPIIVKNAGHIVPSDQPAEYTAILLAMLKAFEEQNN